MNIRSFITDAANISKIATLIIFLALIRTISEPLRLQYFSPTTLTYEQIRPFLIGGLVAGIGLLIMTILSFYSKFKAIIVVAVLTIVALLIIKYLFALNVSRE